MPVKCDGVIFWGAWILRRNQEQANCPRNSCPTPGGFYIYPEPGESVQLQSPDLSPAEPDVCVEFLYYIYSFSNKAQLAVKIQDASGNVTTLWTRAGMQSSAWLLGAITVQNVVQRPFKASGGGRLAVPGSPYVDPPKRIHLSARFGAPLCHLLSSSVGKRLISKACS